MIRPDSNFLTSSPKSAPSKIKMQRNGITCMQLTSPKVHLKDFIKQYTIGTAPFASCPIVRLFMHLLANAPQWRFTCPTNNRRSRYCFLKKMKIWQNIEESIPKHVPQIVPYSWSICPFKMMLCPWKKDWNPRLTSEKYGMYAIEICCLS